MKSYEWSDKRDGMDGSKVCLPHEGDSFDFAGLGGLWKIHGRDTGNRFAIAQFPNIPPRVLAAPLHLHHNEDEYSYVLAGTLGTLVENKVLTAGPGTWVFKPRGKWHTFWNAGEMACQTLEVVSPAGIENYFPEVAAAQGDMQQLARINEEYGIEMDFESIPALCERFGLSFPDLQR